MPFKIAGMTIGDDGKIADGPYAGLTPDQAGNLQNNTAPPDPSTGLVTVTFNGITAQATKNPDGTFTVVGGAALAPGQNQNGPAGTVAPSDLNGTIIGADGTSVVQNVYKGVKADDRYVHSGVGDALVNGITKDNPIAGTVRAGIDIGEGKGLKQAASDFGAGTSFGTLPQIDANGNIVPGDVTKSVANSAGVPGGIPGVTAPVTGPGGIGDLLKGLGLGGGGGSGAVDPAAQSEVDRANGLADVLEVDRQKAGTQADADRGLGIQTRDQQEQSIQQLQDAAAGKVPSAAELALTRQSGIDASRQYGLAAALQGSNPSAALRQASMGAARVAGDTAANGAQLRATEQANARTGLANALTGLRTADQGAVNTDVNQQGTAQTGETTSQGQGVTAEGNILQRQSAKDQADATKTGAEIGAVGALAGGLLTKSDKRAKKDIAKIGLADALAKGVHGVEFEYRAPEEDGPGRHVGVLADELMDVMPGVVRARPDGIKMVDTGHLALGNTAILAELAKRLRALEGKGRK